VNRKKNGKASPAHRVSDWANALGSGKKNADLESRKNRKTPSGHNLIDFELCKKKERCRRKQESGEINANRNSGVENWGPHRSVQN